MDLLLLVLLGFWLMLPSFLPNSAAVVFGGGLPVDMGRSWRGKRLLGDGKTWRGLIGGICAGISLGIIQLYLAFPFDRLDFFGFGSFPTNLVVVIVLAVGSLAGDMVGSMIKRRLNIGRGNKAPLIDQYNFLLGSILLVLLLFPDWFLDNFWRNDGWVSLLAVLLITPILHRGVNIIGYKLGLKKVPW
ncbi:MAG: CDP-2,3-bis-(O-geranylgeranyl)-sn-glycerol synthase [Methanomassiliicoccus sp.]|nr:MAG: CDP-2,3-bis-(O-geranylgeranyl)-sn-glycerol synthase [Methanomassiliicoccus sp.]